MKTEMWLIWKQPETRSRYKIGILNYDNNIYTFSYDDTELKEAMKVGFDYFPGFEDIKKIYTSKELFTNISKRLPNKKRADYLEILNSYNLKNTSTDLEILKATKGRLLTDNYEFVLAFDASKIEFDVAGTRHCPDVKKCKKIIRVNDKLILELDSENKYDKWAIKVFLSKDGQKLHLGYVPRYYSKQLTEMLKSNIKYSAMVQSLNFESEISDEEINANVKLIFNK